jgi:hypothetical protein
VVQALVAQVLHGAAARRDTHWRAPALAATAPTDVGPINTSPLAILCIEAGLPGTLKNAAKTLGTPALANPGEDGVVGQRLVQAIAAEPADRKIDLAPPAAGADLYASQNRGRSACNTQHTHDLLEPPSSVQPESVVGPAPEEQVCRPRSAIGGSYCVSDQFSRLRSHISWFRNLSLQPSNRIA